MNQRLNADFINASGEGNIFVFSQHGKKNVDPYSLKPCLARL
jgi:hypothetical protein